MTKILKCKFCGKLPHMMICKGDDIETEYKLSHNCIFRQNLYSNCGNWYETRRMAILDWNMHRCNRKGGILPRKNNWQLRHPEMYYPNGELK